MPVIDADTHIDETEATWSYMDEKDLAFRPVAVERSVPGEGLRPANRYWLVGSQVSRRPDRDDKRTGTVQATRELLDIPARLRHMDELGVDVHVIYPSFFLRVPTERPEVESALCKSYNRWLADKCGEGHGRLRWVAVLPTMDMDATVREIRFARDNGAVAVFKKAIECGERLAGEPYFDPIYEEASEANLAVCMHSGSGDPRHTNVSPAFGNGLWHQVLPVLDACCSLVLSGVPERFPKLRVGFIEVGSMWVPYVLNNLRARHERLPRSFTLLPEQEMFRACRFYVAYQTQEDLALLLQYGLEDSLVIGSDYTHSDASAELQCQRVMRERAASGEVSPTVVRKLLEDNPRALYGL